MDYEFIAKDQTPYYLIRFQEGPIREVGVNGCQTPDIIRVAIEELERLNMGEFKTVETTQAISHLKEAMVWLARRTAKRQARGVEGTKIP